MLSLGYPKGLIGVEKCLDCFSSKSVSKRRVDLLVFWKKEDCLCPLLIIECKAIPLSKEVEQQVLGYNFFAKAYFVAIANENELKLFWLEKEGALHVINFLPMYKELLGAVNR